MSDIGTAGVEIVCLAAQYIDLDTPNSLKGGWPWSPRKLFNDVRRAGIEVEFILTVEDDEGFGRDLAVGKQERCSDREDLRGSQTCIAIVNMKGTVSVAFTKTQIYAAELTFYIREHVDTPRYTKSISLDHVSKLAWKASER